MFLPPGMQINGQPLGGLFPGLTELSPLQGSQTRLYQEVEPLFFRIPIAFGMLPDTYHLVPFPLLYYILTFFEDKYYQLFFFVSVPTAGKVLVTSQTFSNYFKNE